MSPIILFRDADISPDEKEAMAFFFDVTDTRMDISRNKLVIGRYSVLPFYEEQENDIRLAGATLINSYEQHRYVADIGNWYQDLVGLTPRTWALTGPNGKGTDQLPRNTSFVLKGETNSMKRLWTTHMYAPDHESVRHVLTNLMNDTMIGQQNIYAREYVPLRRVGTNLGGAPITREFRFFVAYGEILCGAYYWSSHVGELVDTPGIDEVPRDFLDRVVAIIGSKCNFYTVDVAIKEDGSPIVIELNDGQMSGLSENNPTTLYRRLRGVLSIHHDARRIG